MTADERPHIARQIDGLEQLLRQFAEEHKAHLTRTLTGMMQANSILAKRLEHIEDMVLALDRRLRAVEAMREETDAVRH